jgi:KDO2-lipid IV(A) lauroyltransferase
METFRMQDLPDDELERRFGEEGTERIGEAYAAGRGAVLATPHLGNWDAGGRWVAKRWGLTAVVEVLRPRRLFDRFVAHRRGLGITIIPLVRGGDATAQCLERLRAGALVALVSDRDLSGTGVEVKMFGRRTKLPPGPAVLALRAGVPLLPACIYQRHDGSWFARVLPDINDGLDDATDVERLTQRLAESFEGLIAAEPAQWHAFQRHWID